MEGQVLHWSGVAAETTSGVPAPWETRLGDVTLKQTGRTHHEPSNKDLAELPGM